MTLLITLLNKSCIETKNSIFTHIIWALSTHDSELKWTMNGDYRPYSLNELGKGKRKRSNYTAFCIKKEKKEQVQISDVIPISGAAPKNSSSSRNPLKRHSNTFDEQWKGTEDCQVKVRQGSLWQLGLVYIVCTIFLVLFTINNCLCRNAHSSQRLGQAVSKQLQRKREK